MKVALMVLVVLGGSADFGPTEQDRQAGTLLLTSSVGHACVPPALAQSPPPDETDGEASNPGPRVGDGDEERC